jgi:hypothetical protein
MNRWDINWACEVDVGRDHLFACDCEEISEVCKYKVYVYAAWLSGFLDVMHDFDLIPTGDRWETQGGEEDFMYEMVER